MHDKPALEAALEFSEAALDQLSDNEFLKDIPVVGIGFKVCKAVAGIRERIYIAKLKAFFDRLDAVDASTHTVMLKSLEGNPEDCKRAGEHLLLLLEQISDLQKSQIMAVFFIAYLKGAVDLPFLLRAWDAIANAYGADLNILLALSNEPAPGGVNAHLQYLHRTGLTMIEVDGTWDSMGATTYKLSPFGTEFVNAYHDVTRSS